MTILFYLHHLNLGGAERVTSILVNELSRRGHTVFVVLYSNIIDSYPISKNVNIIRLPRYRSKRLDHCIKLRKLIKDIHPDVCVGVLYINFLTLLKTTIGLGIPIIASDHTNFHWNENRLKKFTRYYLYRYASAVTILSENDKEFMKSRLHNLRVIYNPLSFPVLQSDEPREKTIICAGRLDAWRIKGFDNMFKIWSKICKKYPDWRLDIAGGGSNENSIKLVQMADELNIRDQVFFWGGVQHLDEVLKKSSIFALSSREEGFPCVLTEAMSQGCAPVAFSIHGNIQEIITDGQDGFIIPDGDLDAFQEKLEELICNEELRSRLGKNAIESMKRFEPDLIVDQWESLLQEVVNKKK